MISRLQTRRYRLTYRCFTVWLFGALMLVSQVQAAEYSAGDACSTAGAYHTKNDATGVFHLVCNGSNWVLAIKMRQDGKIGIGTENITVGTGKVEIKGGHLKLHNRLFFGSDAVSVSGLENIGSAIRVGGGNNNFVDLWGHITELARFSNTGSSYIVNTKLGIGKKAPDVELDVEGDIHYTGVIADVSDGRMKEHIRDLSRESERIAALKPVSFVMKDDPKSKREYGFIAQEVEPLYPELVSTTPDGTKSLNYIGLIAPLVQAVQDQQRQIEILHFENRQLSHRLDVLESATQGR